MMSLTKRAINYAPSLTVNECPLMAESGPLNSSIKENRVIQFDQNAEPTQQNIDLTRDEMVSRDY